MSASRDGWLAAGVALVARGAFVAWAWGRFPASADGKYYDILARRLAEGHGYTWLWPDGAVTPVAHYPVGYPAMLASAYALFGARPGVAMLVNALFGAAMTLGVHVLAREAASRKAALGAALAVGLHPALVPYTAAVMTEGVAASLLVVAAAVARLRRRSWAGWLAAGAALGVATLVRPQCLAFAPVLGLIAPRGTQAWRARAMAAAAMTATALAVCAPWVARNCSAMHQCSLSLNGGWNLLIGAQTTTGAWQEVAVPAQCREVWDEAAKDACFGRAAREEIASAPRAWLARMPGKVGVTLDYFGAAPWYLHEANPAAFPEGAKEALGAAETVVSRLALVLALLALGRAAGPRPRVRAVLSAVGGAAACLTPGYVAYLALALMILALGPRRLVDAPIIVPWTAAVILGTAATHAVFFGAGRYGLAVVPFVTALPFFARALRGNPIPPVARASEASSASSPSPSASAAA